MQKYLAECGLGSRRFCEGLIAEGRVRVDGRRVEVGYRVDPEVESVLFDGRRVQLQDRRYILLNKPRDCLSTCHDPRGRRTVLDLIPPEDARLYPVGRLDRDSEGVLLLTNDGELTRRLLHPGYRVPRTYRVRLKTVPTRDPRELFVDGIRDSGELLRADRVWRVNGSGLVFRLLMHEGRNRQVRRMFAAAGAEVEQLLRESFGPLDLSGLRSGRARKLSSHEIAALKAAVGID